MRRATFEKILTVGHSFTYRAWDAARFPFLWHFHPEYELTLIPRGRGHRFVGDHVDRYGPGDLVLLGPDLPHTWHAPPGPPRSQQAVVIQFRRDCFGSGFFELPELAPVAALLDRSRQGLQFTGAARDGAAGRMAAMGGSTPLGRVRELLAILELLAGAPAQNVRALSSRAFNPVLSDRGRRTIDRVCRFLAERYTSPDVSLGQAAAVAHLSPAAFSRFFRRVTGRTFTAWVADLRVGRACQLLAETDRTIATIALDCGFANLSNFNRRFLAHKGVRPRDYRRQYAGEDA
ncbi:MAG TPA: AraC family transcriptional regulator [Tepidisphaeraceae bacterium]|nr:AraC family transcriptional regulator [Tepidisphaeraceae bacterium]